jgi:hypothetical protein
MFSLLGTKVFHDDDGCWVGNNYGWQSCHGNELIPMVVIRGHGGLGTMDGWVGYKWMSVVTWVYVIVMDAGLNPMGRCTPV